MPKSLGLVDPVPLIPILSNSDMAITLGLISEFLVSIERHLEESKEAWVESGSKTASNPGASAKLASEEMPTDYLDALEDLRDKISAFLGDPAKDSDSQTLLSPMLLWMVPAFCFCSQFLDPLDAHARCVAIQKTRSTHEANFTDDIWDKDLVHSWAASDESRLLLLQGNSRTTKRFERFAVEVIQALRSDKVPQPMRLAYILNTPHRGASSQLAPSDLLQQIAVQCLQYVRPKTPVSFLISMFGSFKGAATSQDWFCILQDICLLIPSLYIIIDLSVLGRNLNETQFWPASIQDLFNSLNSSHMRCRLKVMLLCCHKFTSHVGETLAINAEPAGSASCRNRHQARKYLRSILTDPTDIPVDSVPDVEAFSISRNLPLEGELALTGERSNQAPPPIPRKLSDDTHLDIRSPSLLEPQHREDFKIAIICALTLESDAVQDIFDRRWSKIDYGKMAGDSNHYTMGTIGRHHVVLVHMPGMGKSNGASVAANCRASFPRLGLVLVVGVCGGVPFTKIGAEIILGDVVVSDGLIQYDFGRQFPDRFVRKNDNMPKPSAEIMSLFAQMKGRWGMKSLTERTALHLERLSREIGLQELVQYPGALRDKLYESTYRHKHQGSSDCEVCDDCRSRIDPVCEDALKMDCETLKCDNKHLVPRKRLALFSDEVQCQNTHAGPVIHFGLYASGDKVMKSGEERDSIAKDEGVIAFEMEGSGVWEGFQGRCLVIKGVCDYADSHKNKRWQSYAAATAAACTKAFLESWTS